MLAGGIDFTGDATSIVGSFGFTSPETVVRLMGEYIVGAAGAPPTAGDAATITVGIGVVSTDAAAVGASAMPDPETEPEYPWLFWASHPLWFPTAGNIGNNLMGGARHWFDVKSQRKLKPRESLVCVVQYGDISGTPPVRYQTGGARLLILES